MSKWVRMCGAAETPKPGEVAEIDVEGRTLCVANIGGQLHALDNRCPHRQGPLGQGWIEGGSVLCPWHAWAFDANTGRCTEPQEAEVQVFALRREGDEYYADLS